MLESPNTVKAKHEAVKLLEAYAIESPEEINVEDIAMAQGLLVLDGGLIGAEARLLHNGTSGIIRVKSNGNSSRRRFSIAHELGHWILHKNTTILDFCQSIEEGALTNKTTPLEIEANSFASELLMPRFLFAPLCNQVEPNLNEIKQLSETFDTSLTSTALRFVESTNEKCFIVISKGQEILWWQKNQKSGLKIFEYHQIQKNSSAWKCASGQLAESEMKRISTDAWFPSPPKSLRVEVQEQSIKLGAYPYVLTLLWVSEEEKSFLDDDEDDD